MLVANYGGGSAAVLPVGKDGKLGEASCFVQHTGTSVDKDRQEAPHTHSANLRRRQQIRRRVRPGTRQSARLQVRYESGKDYCKRSAIGINGPQIRPATLRVPPERQVPYVNNEMLSTLTAMSYDPVKGEFKLLNTLPTIPKPDKKNSTAETVVHPNGKFVYTSNRGHNSIAIFAIDEKTGEIKAVGHQGEGIKTPRNFNIDPTGKWMVVANQDGNDIIVYEIDGSTGHLKPTGQKVEVGSPVCVKFVPKE